MDDKQHKSLKIYVSVSLQDQIRAARALSDALDQLGFKHAYIGGFAWTLLGSVRPTEDIDVLMEVEKTSLLDLRERLKEINNHFVEAGIKLYFVKDLDKDALPEEQLRKAKDNVTIETLATGTLGLPINVQSVYEVYAEGGWSGPVKILHPSICILTKFKRWSTQHTSTRPKTRWKVDNDGADIKFMVRWLTSNNMVIAFENYQGRPKLELLKMVREFYDKHLMDADLMDHLRRAMSPFDWKEMTELNKDKEVSDATPA